MSHLMYQISQKFREFDDDLLLFLVVSTTSWFRSCIYAIHENQESIYNRMMSFSTFGVEIMCNV